MTNLEVYTQLNQVAQLQNVLNKFTEKGRYWININPDMDSIGVRFDIGHDPLWYEFLLDHFIKFPHHKMIYNTTPSHIKEGWRDLFVMAQVSKCTDIINEQVSLDQWQSIIDKASYTYHNISHITQYMSNHVFDSILLPLNNPEYYGDRIGDLNNPEQIKEWINRVIEVMMNIQESVRFLGGVGKYNTSKWLDICSYSEVLETKKHVDAYMSGEYDTCFMDMDIEYEIERHQRIGFLIDQLELHRNHMCYGTFIANMLGYKEVNIRTNN